MISNIQWFCNDNVIWILDNLLFQGLAIAFARDIIATSNCIVSMKAIQFPGKGFGIRKVGAIAHKSFINTKTLCSANVNLPAHQNAGNDVKLDTPKCVAPLIRQQRRQTGDVIIQNPLDFFIQRPVNPVVMIRMHFCSGFASMVLMTSLG
jgi:hypothetical protein